MHRFKMIIYNYVDAYVFDKDSAAPIQVQSDGEFAYKQGALNVYIPVDPKDIDKVIDFHIKNQNFDIVVPSMISKTNPKSKHLVKVIFNKSGKILYFSRALIPFNFRNNKAIYYKDLSIVSFLPKALKTFANSKMTYLEKIEGIELLRALEINLNLGTFISKGTSFSVDVNDDLLKAIDIMPNNPIRKKY